MRYFLQRIAVWAMLAFLLAGGLARGASETPPLNNPILRGVGIDQHLNAQLPMELTFKDETGGTVRLADLARGKPIVLVLVQYNCPSLCTAILNDMLSTLKVIPQSIGDEYDVWAVSIDSRETPMLASQKKGGYLRSYQRTRPGAVNASAGWHFLTGSEENITALSSAVGYRYRYDAAADQFVHPAALVLLTPGGKISRYFFGINYDPTDVRLALVEASNGRIGTITDKVLLFCYHYDPASGKYGLAIGNLLRAGAALTVVILFGGLALLWRADRRRTRRLLALVPREGASP
jgi:protein SCO1